MRRRCTLRAGCRPPTRPRVHERRFRITPGDRRIVARPAHGSNAPIREEPKVSEAGAPAPPRDAASDPRPTESRAVNPEPAWAAQTEQRRDDEAESGRLQPHAQIRSGNTDNRQSPSLLRLLGVADVEVAA